MIIKGQTLPDIHLEGTQQNDGFVTNCRQRMTTKNVRTTRGTADSIAQSDEEHFHCSAGGRVCVGASLLAFVSA